MSFNWLNSQDSDGAIKLLVSKDSISFYAFNKSGVTEYTILVRNLLCLLFFILWVALGVVGILFFFFFNL
jgi:hypothetical protein